MQLNKKKAVLQLSLLTAALSSVYVTPVAAHGYMVSPQDYAYSCYEGTTSDPTLCSDTVKNQKNEINQGNAAGDHQAVINNEELCSASKGGEYAVLDIPSANRYSTTIELDTNGEFEVTYKHTAKHKTWYWDLFVTRNGFNPDTDKLTWGDLERLTVIDGEGKEADDYIAYKVKWPEGKSGKHIIYQVWQRPHPTHKPHDELGPPPQDVWDSAEAFYSCANVIVGDHEPGPDESPWVKNEDFATETIEVSPGDQVKARLMYKGYEDFEVLQDITAENVNNEQWKIDLAESINNNATISQYVQVGVLNDDDEIILSDDPSENNIYYTSENWSHLIEKVDQDTSIEWSNKEAEYELTPGKTLSIPVEIEVINGKQDVYSYTAILRTVGGEKPEQIIEGTTENPASFEISVLGDYSVRIHSQVDGSHEQATYEFSVVEEQGEIEYDYHYPEGFGSYVAGDVVKFDGEGIYECYGDWAANCNDEQFLPGVAIDPGWVDQQWRKLD
ncbi:lytic polysaccharide monooxygenase [Vibrio coralliilyticus]|uniref:lytic polysaccharide monooxygenase n=1 Tax=Vibrio coralliilyticus TaxID=190893 RepID=UPI00181629D2|nr:lytic polysaccharide monooxygenase [Vibrio coralliilyticus]NUW69980.1 lytic polysaccharide monooxygenase [Vibrio coralliilyticus]